MDRAHASGESPPAPPPSPSLLRSSEFEFEKLFHSPSSDCMESEPGSPSTSDCDLSLSYQPTSRSGLAVPNHHAYHSDHHGNGLASCICQISRQTEALSVSFPSDGSCCYPDHSGSAASSLGLSGRCPNPACGEERLLDVDLSRTEKRERKISLKRNHDDISMDDSDPTWLVIEVDPMVVGGNKKSCQERTCPHGSSRSSPKHGRRQPIIVSSMPCTSDFTHDHSSGQTHPQVNVVTSSGSYPHWPNGFSQPRVVNSSCQVPVTTMGMSSAAATRTSTGFDDQQMDCQGEDPRVPVLTRVDDMDCEVSLPQFASSPFSFNAQVPAVSSGPVHPAGSHPFASFRPHAHTFSAGFKTCTNVSNSPHSPSISPSGLVNLDMSHLGVPGNNLATPRTQQFDFYSFHEPSGTVFPSSPHDCFSKSL